MLVLLEYCLWFWLASLGRRWYGAKTANLLLIGGVVVSSLASYFTYYPSTESSARAAWPFERWGLVWGVLLFWLFPKVKQMVSPTMVKTIVACVLCLVLGVAYLKFKTEFFWGEYLLKIVLGVVIITFLFILSSKRTFGNKAAFFLGGISYEVYLSHGFIMRVLDDVCPSLVSGVYILLTVMLTIVFSTVIHYAGKPIVRMIRTK